MTLTPEEGRRLHVLTLLESTRITATQAAEALGLTVRQLRRLRGALRREGPAALIHGNRGRPSSASMAPGACTSGVASLPPRLPRRIPASCVRAAAAERSPPRAPDC